MKHILITVLLAITCISTGIPVSAAGVNNVSGTSDLGNNNELSEEEWEFWENYEWDTLDLSQNAEIEDEKDSSYATVIEQNSNNIVMTRSTSSSGQWIQEEGTNGRWWYRHEDGTYTTNGWEYINGYWYYFDKDGWMLTGWIYYKNNWYYCSSSGAMQTGWVKANGKWYYLNSSGVMQTGWILVNGTYYYCSSSGAMQTGWVKTGNIWYYCNESSGAWIDNTGTQMIQEALKYVGNPYVYGGNSLTNGIDCSGYVQQISAKVGITTPRVSQQQYNSSRKIAYSDLQPGDLVFFSSSGSTSSITHVAFYVGRINGSDNQIVHAANSKEGIIVSAMRSNRVGCGTYWR